MFLFTDSKKEHSFKKGEAFKIPVVTWRYENRFYLLVY